MTRSEKATVAKMAAILNPIVDNDRGQLVIDVEGDDGVIVRRVVSWETIKPKDDE